MPRRYRALSVVLAVVLAAPGAAAQAPGYDGAAATGIALRKLGSTARVLHIGAHPDDENTALFAPIVLGRGADAAYLSLTRGEGGQNAIGPELGTALGLIRSEELLAARRLDGARQFFTRAVDYGYSKSADEAFRHWPRDSLLSDVVAVIRRYRPDVVVAVFSGTPLDGHGQHQASGILALEGFLAAGDPARFPEQIRAGLRPHTPAQFYWSGRFSAGGPDVELATGSLDPLLGRSYHQVAMASRSRHRSQDMGTPQAPGPRRTGFDRIDPADPPPPERRGSWGGLDEGVTAGSTTLFVGVDSLLSQRAQSALDGATGDERRFLERAVHLLRSYEDLVAGVRERYDALEPWTILPGLSRAQGILAGLADAAERRGLAPDLLFHLRAELADVRAARLRAANVELDVVAGEDLVVPGQTFDLELSVWNGGVAPLTAAPRPVVPAGWAVSGDERASAVVAPGERVPFAYRITVPDAAAPTTPYYLDPRDPPSHPDMYRWPADYEVRNEPFAAEPVRGEFTLRFDDDEPALTAGRPAAWVGVDSRSGEFRRPVRVVPAVAVSLAPVTAVLAGAAARALPFTVRLRSQAPGGVAGTVRLDLPAGWRADPASARVAFAEEGEERTVAFRVTPARAAEGEHAVRAVFEAGDGRRFDLGYDVVDYPHIAPHHLYAPATARVRAFDVRVADVRVGYVESVGDGIPEALDQLGVAWERLDPAALATADLSRFDAIILGIRAYAVRPDLVANNRRLLDWVRAGGTLVVQYNQYEFSRGDLAPWPVTIARPHGRVTDETADVTVLEPRHPALTTPNPIGPADWAGWVQERGLYFLETWDGPFTPLLAMSDPGEEPLTGSLLVAPLGDGLYVYTGLAFFRQLPAGVPGAYRLLANLISLGAADTEASR